MLNSVRSRLLLNTAAMMIIIFVITIFSLYKFTDSFILGSAELFQKRLILDVLDIIERLHNNDFKKSKEVKSKKEFHLFYLMVLDKDKKPIYIQGGESGPYSNISTTCKVESDPALKCFDEFASHTDKKEGVLTFCETDKFWFFR